MTIRKMAVAALMGAAAGMIVIPAVAHAQVPVCPVGMYWNVDVAQCLYYDPTVYVNPPNPIIGPVGPVGAGGVVGPVGVGPVGPGPVGPGPVGPGPRGPGR